jgi:hypothetical protein
MENFRPGGLVALQYADVPYFFLLVIRMLLET